MVQLAALEDDGMVNTGFENEVIDRLARIEEGQKTTVKTLDSIGSRLSRGDDCMDGIDRRLISTELLLDHPDTGLVKNFKCLKDDVQGLQKTEELVLDKDTGLAATRKRVNGLRADYLKGLGLAAGAGAVIGFLGNRGLSIIFPSLFGGK